jgi:hypothetical protein
MCTIAALAREYRQELWFTTVNANCRNLATSVAKPNATSCGDTNLRRPTELADPHQIASGAK